MDAEQDFPLIHPARIRVLLVPVHPIKRDTFRRYVDLISQFCVVSVADLSPPAGVSSSSKFLENLSQADGQMLFNFITSYNREHSPLEEFQPHRQIMGVIGIVDCQETPSLNESSKKFQQIVQRYPPILASRCFAFEPTPGKNEETKGIVTIPNEGQLSFYLSSIMNEFALDLLVAFGALAQHIERRPLIQGPVMTLGIVNPIHTNASQPTNSPGVTAPPNAALAGGGTTSSLASAYMAAPAQDNSVFGQFGSMLAPDKNRKRTPARSQKLIGDLYLMAGRLDIAISNFLSAIEAMKQNSDFYWHAATLESYYAAMVLTLINKAGVGGVKSDKILESPTLQSVLNSPTAVSNPQLNAFLCDACERFREVVLLYERGASGGPQAPNFCPLLATQACLTIAKLCTGLWKYRFGGTITGGAGVPFWSVDPKGGATDYASRPGAQSGTGAIQPVNLGPTEKIVINGGVGVTRAEVSSWISRARSFSFFKCLVLSDQVWITTTIAAIYSAIGYNRKHAFYLRQTALLVLSTLRFSREGSTRSPTRLQIGLIDRNPETGSMQLFSEQDSVTGKLDEKSLYRGRTNGALECMKRVCEVMGIALRAPKSAADSSSFFAPLSDDEEDWLDDFDKDDDLQIEKTMLPSSPVQPPPLSPSPSVASLYRQRVRIPRLRFGWPTLQIDVLKECIEIAQAVEDFSSTILFSTRLLRRMNRHMGRDEQLELSEVLQSVVLRTRAATAEIQQPPLPQLANSDQEKKRPRIENIPMPVMARGVMGGVAGVPVIRKLIVLRQPTRKVPVQHQRNELEGGLKPTAPRDLFIYNPFAQSVSGRNKVKEEKVTLVANEPAYFNVTLANPFAFDLEIHSITLCTTDADFEVIPSTTIIPAETRSHVIRLSGIPRSTGTLHIHGCKVRLFGGCVEEMVQPVQKALDDPKRRTKDGRRKRQEERERFGKKPAALLFEKGLKAKAAENMPNWSIPIEVIPEQPILQVNKSERISLGALMVFEGERTQFSVDLENIGYVPVNFLRVSFLETFSADVPQPPTEGVEEPEVVFERDVYQNSLRAFWVEHEENERNPIFATGSMMKIGPSIPEMLVVNIQPGEKITVRVGVFGKRWCTGCMLKFEYAHIELTSDTKPPNPIFYAREIDLPLILTVQPALQASNIDVIIAGLRAGSNAAMASSDGSSSQSRDEQTIPPMLEANMKSLSLQEMTVTPTGVGEEDGNASRAVMAVVDREFFLVTFDLRNVWSQPFEALFEIYDAEESTIPSMVSKFLINPGMTKRVMLPIRRIDLPDAILTRPIPTPQWRQFVVGRTVKMSSTEELSRRVAFWLKEILLGGLDVGDVIDDPRKPVVPSDEDTKKEQVMWRKGRVLARWGFGRGRWGLLDALREVRLEPSMVDVVLAEKVSFSVDVWVEEGDGGVIRVGKSRFRVQYREFVNITWTLTNQPADSTRSTLVLRIQPVQELGGGQLDLIDPVPLKRLVYTGSLQVPLRPLRHSEDEGSQIVNPSHTLPVMFLARGVYRFLYHTESVPMPGEELACGRKVVWGSEEVIVEVE
ncbi:hypothetical protein HDU67_005353 [Dinochytrium kinnereticum]|nr:hypothetical protein HDU67_005353 [Dinochytrium kinnereticum]